jgi:ABC-type multidrug transport system permease subunit
MPLFIILFLTILVIVSLLSIGFGLFLGWIFPSISTGEALLTGAIIIGLTLGFSFKLMAIVNEPDEVEEIDPADFIAILPKVKSRYGRKSRKK